MEKDISFDQIAAKFNVKSLVIRRLYDITVFKEDFEQIISANSTTEFWDLVDSKLSRDLSLSLHRIDIELENVDTDFDFDLEPTIQKLYSSYCSLEKRPTGFVSSSSKELFSQEYIFQIASQILIYDNEKKLFLFSNTNIEEPYFLSPFTLFHMCSNYVSPDGSPWKFFPDPNFREAYTKAAQFVEKHNSKNNEKKFSFFQKLRNFSFSNDISLQEEVSSFGKITISERFDVHSEFIHALLTIMNQVSQSINSENIDLPNNDSNYFVSNDDFYEKQTEQLLSEINENLENRSSLVIDSDLLQNRSGNPSFLSPKPSFLAQLFFYNPYGKASPLPFSNASVDVPTSSFSLKNMKIQNRAVLRRFIAQQLSMFNYSTTTTGCLDVLVDVLTQDIQEFGKCAALLKSSNAKQSDQEIMEKALREFHYSIPPHNP